MKIKMDHIVVSVAKRFAPSKWTLFVKRMRISARCTAWPRNGPVTSTCKLCTVSAHLHVTDTLRCQRNKLLPCNPPVTWSGCMLCSQHAAPLGMWRVYTVSGGFVAEVSRILIRLEERRQDQDDWESWIHYFSVSPGFSSLSWCKKKTVCHLEAKNGTGIVEPSAYETYCIIFKQLKVFKLITKQRIYWTLCILKGQ